MRTWVSFKSVTMGYGEYPFVIHDRKLEATILEVKDNKVTYAFKTNKDEHLGDCIGTIPVDSFLTAYEPFQETIKFICYQNGNHTFKEFTIDEKKDILSKITKSRILG